MTQIKRKILYFDIDGTILDASTKAVKANLQKGQLEQKIKERKFDKIFCLDDKNEIFQSLEDLGQGIDNTEILYTLCFDAFTDFEWFVNSVHCFKTSDRRIPQIDFKEDWWFMDDQADIFLKKCGKCEILTQYKDQRILMPNPEGDGEDILAWLEKII